MDETFAFGLLMLAAAAVGSVRRRPTGADGGQRGRADPPDDGDRPPGAVSLATFANPSHIFGVLGGFGILFRTIGLEVGPPSPQPISLVRPELPGAAIAPFARSFQAYFAILVVSPAWRRSP